MCVYREPVYLAIGDAALRSSLSARLGMAGHAVVSMQDVATLARGRHAPDGLFVVDGDLLPFDRETWADMLGATTAPGTCIILVRGPDGRHGPFLLADRSNALTAIEAAMAQCDEIQISG